MGFQQGLSGLNAAARNLDVIGNNVANANTVGFKGSQAQFADVYANAQGGSTGAAVGIGVKVAAIAQQFGQGNITATSNPLDMAISGQGFYQLDNNGAIAYSRNGQFQMDQNGYIVNPQGHKLTGYPAANGVISTGSAGPLQLPTAAIAPLATSTSDVGVNLDSRATGIAAATVFDPTDPTTYTSSTAMTTYDSLGNNHVATLYFRKATAPANTWNTYMTVDGLAPNGSPVTALNTGALGTLAFSTAGVLTTPAAPGIITTPPIVLTNGATSLLTIDIDFSTTTQFGALFGVTTLNQNGYTSGQLNGFSTSADGTIMGRYTNGQSQPLGQVLLVNFSNPQGLQPLGNNEWSVTATSGQPLVGVPGTSSLGILQSGATEDSNVDLTAELVNMITAQRVYQANAQTIKAQDTIMQTITNLR